MSTMCLWIFEAPTDEWAETFRNALPSCPRIFFFARLTGNRFAIGMYTEDKASMDAEIRCFEQVAGISGIWTEECTELFVPAGWKMEVQETGRKETLCGVLPCDECPTYDDCLGCPGTIWYRST